VFAKVVKLQLAELRRNDHHGHLLRGTGFAFVVVPDILMRHEALDELTKLFFTTRLLFRIVYYVL
jgi:hypothetical protein